MRTWVYCYKSSDGLRHEGEMSAPGKDDVYAALRKRGIRAIKVSERIVPIERKGFRGLRFREWAVLGGGVGLALLLAGSYVTLHHGDRKSTGVSSDVERTGFINPSNPAYARILVAVESIRESHRKVLEGIDFSLLSNDALIEHSESDAMFRDEIARGKQRLQLFRDKAKSVFLSQYEQIPQGSQEIQIEAQRMYGVLMEELDGYDEQLEGDECALELLIANKGKWHVKNGIVVWNDPNLTAQFARYRRDRPAGTARWRKDFCTPIESEVICIPDSVKAR